MIRKPTKTTRGPKADEKKFLKWLKWQPCVCCGVPGPSIVHHCKGSTFRHNKVLIGHWFCISLCQICDNVITRGSSRAFVDRFGPQSSLWIGQYKKAPVSPPGDVIASIIDWGR